MVNGKVNARERQVNVSTDLLRKVLAEVQALRAEVMMLFPEEDLEGYAHADQVKQSYKRAVAQYPPAAV